MVAKQGAHPATALLNLSSQLSGWGAAPWWQGGSCCCRHRTTREQKIMCSCTQLHAPALHISMCLHKNQKGTKGQEGDGAPVRQKARLKKMQGRFVVEGVGTGQRALALKAPSRHKAEYIKGHVQGRGGRNRAMLAAQVERCRQGKNRLEGRNGHLGGMSGVGLQGWLA